MSPRLLVAPIALLLLGCERPYRLEERWRPLVEVVERPRALGGDVLATTIGTRVYVPDLDAWKKEFPADSPQREALLIHEREHAVRQFRMGLGPWLARYLRDRRFMWQEEQRGWELHLRALVAAGAPVDTHGVARSLAGYRNLAGPMVDYEEALAWAESVVSAR